MIIINKNLALSNNKRPLLIVEISGYHGGDKKNIRVKITK